MELEQNLLDLNGNELEHKLELEDMKRTNVCLMKFLKNYKIIQNWNFLKPLFNKD